MLTNSLNKNTPVPLYYQLMGIIKENIDNDILKAGDLLPSERELAEIYKVSRPTIRQALKELVNEGMLVREKGKGTYVAEAEDKTEGGMKIKTFYDKLKSNGNFSRIKVLEQKIINSSDILSQKLNINPGKSLIYLHRLKYIKNEPLISVKNYIPYKLCPTLITRNLNDKSLSDILKKFNIIAYRKMIKVDARVADEEDREYLQLENNTAIQFITKISFSKEDQLINYSEISLKGNKGGLELEIYP
ncbi:MAG: GntR family transcriptional regulator [bacterium]